MKPDVATEQLTQASKRTLSHCHSVHLSAEEVLRRSIVTFVPLLLWCASVFVLLPLVAAFCPLHAIVSIVSMSTTGPSNALEPLFDRLTLENEDSEGPAADLSHVLEVFDFNAEMRTADLTAAISTAGYVLIHVPMRFAANPEPSQIEGILFEMG